MNLCLATISASYPGRVELSMEGKKIWARLLEDVEDAHLNAAVADLCATEKWPPSIAEVRERALDLQAGELAPVTAYEAWDMVRRSLHETVELPHLTREAKKQIGGEWQIKNDSSGTAMNHFVKAYNALVVKQRRLRTATPAAKQIAASNAPAPAIPSPEERRELPPMAADAAGPEEVRELLGGLTGYRPVGEK